MALACTSAVRAPRHPDTTAYDATFMHCQGGAAMFSGVVLKLDQTPGYVSWIQYVSVYRWVVGSWPQVVLHALDLVRQCLQVSSQWGSRLWVTITSACLGFGTPVSTVDPPGSAGALPCWCTHPQPMSPMPCGHACELQVCCARHLQSHIQQGAPGLQARRCSCPVQSHQGRQAMGWPADAGADER